MEKVSYTVKIEKEDLLTLNMWGNKNNYPVSWALRRGVKDFIKNYVTTGIMPSGEVVNLGCIIKKDS